MITKWSIKELVAPINIYKKYVEGLKKGSTFDIENAQWFKQLDPIKTPFGIDIYITDENLVYGVDIQHKPSPIAVFLGNLK